MKLYFLIILISLAFSAYAQDKTWIDSKTELKQFPDSVLKNNIWYYSEDAKNAPIRNFYPLDYFYQFGVILTGKMVSYGKNNWYSDSCENCLVSVTVYSDLNTYHVALVRKWIFTEHDTFAFIQAIYNPIKK